MHFHGIFLCSLLLPNFFIKRTLEGEAVVLEAELLNLECKILFPVFYFIFSIFPD